MNRHLSETLALPAVVWFHYNSECKKYGFAKVFGDFQGVAIVFEPGYPKPLQKTAFEFLDLRIHCGVMASDYEWMELTNRGWTEQDFKRFRTTHKRSYEAVDRLGQGLIEKALESMREAARTGSPLGRAGGGEPAAPQADSSHGHPKDSGDRHG